MIGHIKSHNIVLNEDDESEDEGEDIMAQMGEEFAHKGVEKQKKRTEKMNSALLLMLINCAFAFSEAGQQVSSYRNRLLPDKVNKIMVIKGNI